QPSRSQDLPAFGGPASNVNPAGITPGTDHCRSGNVCCDSQPPSRQPSRGLLEVLEVLVPLPFPTLPTLTTRGASSCARGLKRSSSMLTSCHGAVTVMPPRPLAARPA